MITTLINRNDRVGNGTAGPFPFEFKIINKSDLTVYVNGSLKALGVEYEISGTSWESGGNVLFNEDYYPEIGDPIALIRAMPLTQLTDYIEGGKLPAAVVEGDFDKTIMKIQDLKNYLTNAFMNIIVSAGPLFPILTEDPDTSGWGIAEAPALWFNSTELKAKMWNGTEIVYIEASTIFGHKISHQKDGADEISVTGLSGLLANDQHVLDAEVLAVAEDKTKKGAASGYASLDATAKIPIAQMASGTPDGTKFIRDDRTLVAPQASGDIWVISDDVIVGANTQQQSNPTEWTKIKEIKINKGQTFRIKFDGDVTEGTTGKYRVYKDGVPFGTEWTITETSYVTKTEDLKFEDSTSCQLYWIRTVGTGWLYTRNFRVCGIYNPIVNID